MHKIFIGLFIFVLTSHSTLFAQKPFANLNLVLKEPSMFAVIPDTSGDLCIFYKDPKNYSFALINPQGKPVRTRSFERMININNGQETYMGATITEKAFILYFSNSPDYRKYSVYYISRSDSNDYTVHDILLRKPEGDKIINIFTDSRYTYVCTANSDNNRVTFIQFLNENEIKMHSFQLTKELFNYIKKDNYTLIKNSQSYTVLQTTEQRKMYVNEKDKIIYTIDDKKGEEDAGKTRILEFDLAQDNMRYYVIREKGEGYENEYSNSFYYKGKLFRIQLLYDKIGLFIFDVQTGKLEKKYEYARNKKLELVSGEVFRKTEDENFFSYKEEALEEGPKFFSFLSEGLPSISVTPLRGDTMLILIGSFNREVTRGKDVYVHYYTTRFHTFLTSPDYQMVSVLNEYPEFYKVDKFKEALKAQGLKINTSITFRIGSKLYLGYNLKKDNSYKITEIL